MFNSSSALARTLHLVPLLALAIGGAAWAQNTLTAVKTAQAPKLEALEAAPETAPPVVNTPGIVDHAAPSHR